MFKTRKRRLLAVGGTLVLAMGLGVAVASSASAAGLTADCKKTQDWGSGWQGECKIVNDGPAVDGWTVAFDLTAGAINSTWDANRAQSGSTYTFTPTWNKTIPANGSVVFGFIGSGAGSITNCKLNNGACTGGTTPGDTQKPTNPSGLASPAQTSTSVDLKWTASTDNVGVASYTVYRSGSAVTTVTGTTATVSGLTASTAYSFTVRAKDAAGNESGDSNAVSVSTKPNTGGDTQKPTAPTNLKVTATGQNSVSLSWSLSTDNVGVTQYRVFVNGVDTDWSTDGVHVQNGLQPNTTYSFYVKAKDDAGNLSDASNTVSAKTTGVVDPPPPPPGGKFNLGYYAQWDTYARNYQIADIEKSGQAAYMTHLNYAFGNVTGGQCVIGDSEADINKHFTADQSVDGVADTWDGTQVVAGNFNQLIKLKKKQPNLKMVLSFGGWTWSGGFGQASQNPGAFADSCYNLLNDSRWKGLWDGIDIDWEHPNACGLTCDTSGPNAYKAITKALRDKFGASFIISSAITADATAGGHMDVTDYAGGIQNLTYVLPMTYDYFGGWSAQGPTAPHSPLTSYAGIPQTGFNTTETIDKLIGKGVPASKIAVGAPMYGRGWTGVTQSAPGGSATGPAAGIEPGVQDYKVLITQCPPTGTIAGTAYAYCGGNWWSYDTVATISAKAQWAKNKGLKGTFFWEASGDRNAELTKALYNNQ
jgi:chitinase